MGRTIGEVLGLAVGIAVSPVPIAAVILMLLSRRARVNAVTFMVGWVVGIAAVTTVVVLIPGLGNDDGQPGDAAGWLKLALGLALLVFAARRWRTRPGPGDEPPLPRWMTTIDTLRPGAALGLGFLLSAVNPKNLALAVAAGASIGAADLATGETVATVVVFTAIAAVTVVAPVVGYLLTGERLDASLDATKDWLIHNNATVMAVLFVVFGAVLVGNGVQILSV